MSYNNLKDDVQTKPNIKVIGVGGAGNNAIKSMMQFDFEEIEFIAANTDLQTLSNFDENISIHLGNVNDRKGLGAGANPEVGKAAALESEAQIKEKLQGADMVIISAGMGGGTGTGAAPIIAKIAKSMGALTIAIVTTPFHFEGNKRMENSIYGLQELKKEVDSLVIVSNEKLKTQYGSIPMKDSFVYADTILKQTVKTLLDIIFKAAYINLDFADIITVMKNKGNAIISVGYGNGKDKAIMAAQNAISSPILEFSVNGAKDMMIHIQGGEDFTLDEVDLIVNTIKEKSGDNANIIFGFLISPEFNKEIKVSIVATGLMEEKQEDKTNTFNHFNDNISNKTENKFEFENLPFEEDELPSEEDFEDEDEFVLEKTKENDVFSFGSNESVEKEKENFSFDADFEDDNFLSFLNKKE